MAFCELKYFSNALQKATAADILLPEQQTQGPFPVLYLLHGLSDDNTVWQRRTSIERYVAGLPLIVVMPDGGRGFYSDAEQGMAWESAIVKDLVGYVDAMFQTRAEPNGAGCGRTFDGRVRRGQVRPEIPGCVLRSRQPFRGHALRQSPAGIGPGE